jgi:predicted RNase H-like nuclease (RuvC/YqgF family)
MLPKILFVLSALALAGGTYLGFKNRQDFIATRTEKIEINSQRVKPTLAKIDEEIANIGTEIGKWKDAVASKKEKEVALANAKANLQAKTNDLTKLAADIQAKQTELTTLEAELIEMLQGETIDTITAKIESLNQEIASLQTDKEQAEKEHELAKGRIGAQEATVASLRRAASERTKGINQNALVGTVIATNQDYGFAVLNIGERSGLTGGSKLIVKRGNQRVGTLNVSSISDSKTIADIDKDSVTPGLAVSPGDRVILERIQR